MVVTSPAFQDGGRIPAEHCMKGVPGGKNVSIPLSWTGAPPGTASFAVFVIDRHPIARNWVHWAVVDVPPSVTSLTAGASGSIPAPARELVNTFGDRGYGGPMPPPGTGDHLYEVTVYALDVPTLEVPTAPSAADLERAVAGHVLAAGTITGIFSR
ncbi:MAG: YbhB/YbcL family Raf kinase inhibitor-like protein [Anaerosomatales bacterium]|nr:YbhB/YbcL family Raf kinase inhibitor-like protein [Anaerosomatales bacterium]